MESYRNLSLQRGSGPLEMGHIRLVSEAGRDSNWWWEPSTMDEHHLLPRIPLHHLGLPHPTNFSEFLLRKKGSPESWKNCCLDMSGKATKWHKEQTVVDTEIHCPDLSARKNLFRRCGAQGWGLRWAASPAFSSFRVCRRGRELPRPKPCPSWSSPHTFSDQRDSHRVTVLYTGHIKSPGILSPHTTLWSTIFTPEFHTGLAKVLSALYCKLDFPLPHPVLPLHFTATDL